MLEDLQGSSYFMKNRAYYVTCLPADSTALLKIKKLSSGVTNALQLIMNSAVPFLGLPPPPSTFLPSQPQNRQQKVALERKKYKVKMN